MKKFIHQYENVYEKDFNYDIIDNRKDMSIEDFIIMSMREFEIISNITIEKIEIVTDQDEVDLNRHAININYKKKNLDLIEFPKYKYINKSSFGEIKFTIRIQTNLNEKVIEKSVLYPIMAEDGFYYNNGKQMKPIWQMVDASTYSQKGRITLKSRMPIIIYQNKHRMIEDVTGTNFTRPSYSYALDSSSKKNAFRPSSTKKRTKFINPLIIYISKMGFRNTIEFFGMKGIVHICTDYNEKDLNNNYIFKLDEVFIKVNKDLFDKYELIGTFVTMCFNLSNKEFPVEMKLLEDQLYWTCRLGYVGSIKSKNLNSFKEKGLTTLYMIERLLDTATIRNLRLPDIYKSNIYYVLYWMITNFNNQRDKQNIDMRNKRLRKNEYIILGSIGKKINENINKIIEKMSKSRQNTMETLLELFNFDSNIIVQTMRNMSDLIKTDELVNDLNFLMDIAYSSKGFQSQMESSSKMIAAKYRNLDISMIGRLDLNVSSNSDIGLSGSLVPYAKVYNGYYFDPESEYCENRYLFDKALVEDEGIEIPYSVDTFENYIEDYSMDNYFIEKLAYMPITIHEKDD